MTKTIPEGCTHYLEWWSGTYYYKRIDGVWYEWSDGFHKWELTLATWYKFYWFFGWRMSVMGMTHRLRPVK